MSAKIEKGGGSIAASKESPRAPSFMLPVFKLPIFLYQLGLGRLMGRRFMMLTHIGRRSGRIRRTILAVLDFNPATREIKTISAWRGSDWFRNIQAAPALEVACGADRYAPMYRLLSAEEIAALFIEYRQRHRLFSSIVCKIPGWNINSTPQEFLALARTLRGIAFRPVAKAAPSAGEKP